MTFLPAPSRRQKLRADGSEPNPPTTADATPTLAAAVRGLAVGPALDDMVSRSLIRLGQSLAPRCLSTTWEGASRVVGTLTALGCYLEVQVHGDRSLCRVLRVLRGNALAKQLASAEGLTLPEAVARAAVLACLEMEPPGA
jgi:hypothetical protein